MAHTHNEECERLHEALQALQTQQQPPRSSMSGFAAATPLVEPERGFSPEGVTPEVETEVQKIRKALEAMECDR